MQSKEVNFDLLKSFYSNKLIDYFNKDLGKKSLVAEEHLLRLLKLLMPDKSFPSSI